jgi:polysaccharide export outer membrane protein
MDLTDPTAAIPVEQLMIPEVALIAPGDELRLELLSHTEISGRYVVTRNGMINIALLGTVQAAGKTIDSLDTELTQALNQYYRFADVSVNLVAQAPRSVFVLGEVENPGRHEFLPGDRILHGLATAGGMSRQARSDNIVLMRRMPDGREHAYRLAFNRLHTGVYPQDIYLQPGDVVFVPRTRFFTFTEYANEFLNVLSRAATTALIVDDLVGLRTRALTVGR